MAAPEHLHFPVPGGGDCLISTRVSGGSWLMPAIKSPAVLLKIWNKAKVDYLKLNHAEELEPKEDVPFKKAVRGLTRLRKLAQRDGEEGEEFGTARDGLLVSMQKLRKLFRPKKDRAGV